MSYTAIIIDNPDSEFLWSTHLGKRYLIGLAIKDSIPSIDSYLDMRNSLCRNYKLNSFYAEREIEAIDIIMNLQAKIEYAKYNNNGELIHAIK